jgi:hypothetical protein
MPALLSKVLTSALDFLFKPIDVKQLVAATNRVEKK